MDWKDIGSLLGGIAPTLGTILGGPLGGAAGSILSGALGTAATPEAVGAALSQPASPEAIAKAEAEVKEKYGYLSEAAKADAQQVIAINQTMQAETAAGVSWWHWRHLIGYATLLWAVAVLPPFVLAMWKGDASVINAVTAGLGSATLFFGILAGLNGYVAQDTTRRIATATTGQAGGLLGAVLGNIIGKK